MEADDGKVVKITSSFVVGEPVVRTAGEHHLATEDRFPQT